MTQAREHQVSLEATPFYHCYVRCVRRAFLCGEDYATGENYDHRKQWIVSRLRFLSYVYAIDICAYAVMSNHYHVVLHVDEGRAKGWSKEEVVERWMQLYKGNVLVDRWLKNPDAMDNASMAAVDELIDMWRERLCSISWFMRGVNETIARMANEEENCKGRFWEGRFKSQALLDEAAVLSCMAYVDLNPIRAKMAETPEDSDHTSIQERIAPRFNLVKAIQQQVDQQSLKRFELPLKPLVAFEGGITEHPQSGILFSEKDYIQLVDYTGRLIRPDKRGAIPSHLPPILQRLALNQKAWMKNTTSFEQQVYRQFGKKRQPRFNTT